MVRGVPGRYVVRVELRGHDEGGVAESTSRKIGVSRSTADSEAVSGAQADLWRTMNAATRGTRFISFGFVSNLFLEEVTYEDPLRPTERSPRSRRCRGRCDRRSGRSGRP